MLRTLAGALAFLALLAPQELKTEVLDKLKSATVFVEVEERGGVGWGSGFLFLKRGSTAYLMTCEHVVGTSDRVKVIFWSGTPQEKVKTARVVATDPSRDIACLIIRDAPGLPAILELGKKTEVRETETVFAAGFPFGAMMGTRDKNPEISISKSSVSSIRRHASGDMAAVQIAGEVNPGNSGGPLVTADGRVIGVIASKLRGTTTAFAVPSEEIQGFLQGRVKASTFRKVGGTATSGKYEITLSLVDPLATLKGAGIAWVNETQVKTDLKAEKDGTWKKAHASMKSVEFDIDEDLAVETIEFKKEGGEPNLAVVFQCYFIRADGQTVWTEPATHDIDFGAGSEPAVRGGRDGKTPTGAPKPEPDEPEPPPAPEAPAGPVVALTLPDALTLSAETTAPSVYGGLALAPDGSALYVLDLSDGLVFKLDPDTLKVTAKLEVHESAVAMALTPDGKTLYVGGRIPSIVERERDRTRGPAGTLQVIATASFTTTTTLDLKGGVIDLVATDRGLVAASCQAQWDGLEIIDVAKKTEDFVFQVYGGGALKLSRDQRRVYVGDTGLSPGDFRCVPLRKEQGKYLSYDSIYHGEHSLGGSFELSPDGRFLIGARGSVLRIGRTREADLRFLSKIEPHQVAAVSPESSTIFTVTADGFFKTYDLGGFELQKSVKFGKRAEKLALDAKRRKLFGIFTEVAADPRFEDRQRRIGRVGSMSLGAK